MADRQYYLLSFMEADTNADADADETLCCDDEIP